MWAFGCGIVSSGLPLDGRALAILAGVLIAGPLVTGTSQAANDWFDRHVDAINEPDRPIPSGRVPGRWGLYVALIWTGVSLLVATALGPFGFAAAVLGLLLAWAYSAPPLRLKQDGWLGNAACAACYEGLPWITGVAVMSAGAPSLQTIIVAVLYSLGAHGIMTLNDFKSVEGDKQMNIRSLPVQLGVKRAAHVACWTMALPQIGVMILLIEWGQPMHAGGIAVLLAVQAALMIRFLQAPRDRAPWYNGTGTLLYVIGMLVTAFALRAM
jgi:chlorophyll synthase